MTYTAKVKNNSDGAYKVDAIALEIQSNTNVSYEIVGLAVDDVLAPGEEKTFEIRLATNAAEQEGTIRLKYEFSPFESKDCLVLSGSAANVGIGTEIDCGGEGFYIYKVDGNEVYAIAKWNLKVGGAYNSSWTAYAESEITNMQDASCIGYTASGTRPFNCVATFGDNAEYAGSLTESYISNYRNILTKKGYVFNEMRLVSKAELSSLCGLGENNYGACTTTNSWLYQTTYWTGSSNSATEVWYMHANQNVGYNVSTYERAYGVRPVIKIGKNKLKDSESCIVTSGEKATLTIGNVFDCGGEEFYVYKIEDGKVYGLAKWNLKVGGVAGVTSWTAYSDSEIANIQDPQCVGYDENSSNTDVRYCTTPFGASSDYSGSIAQAYVDTYREILSENDFAFTNVRLMERDEMTSLCSLASDTVLGDCGTTYPWLYSTTYWFGTTYSSTNVWRIRTNRRVNNGNHNYSYEFGIRPVVEISADRLRDSESCTVILGEKATLGIDDEFKCGSEYFYVYKVDGDTVYGLAKYNLKVGGDYDTEAKSYTTYSANEVTNMQDSDCRGDISELTIRKCMTVFGENTTYSGSTAQAYVENYRKIMAQKNYGFDEMRLIERAELSSLCGISDSAVGACSTDNPWVYHTSYWTGTAYSSSYIWFVSTSNRIDGGGSPDNQGRLGVRPAVAISKSKLVDTTQQSCLLTSGSLRTLTTGNEIDCGGEEFYVYSTSGDDVYALAKYNLKVGGYSNIVENTYSAYSSSEATNMQDENCGVPLGENYDAMECATKFGASNAYEESYVRNYVREYRSKMGEKGYQFDEMRLITRSELTPLCGFANNWVYNVACAETYPWVYHRLAWQQDALGNYVYFINTNKNIGGYMPARDPAVYGVRPVVKLSKSRLEDWKNCQVTSGVASSLKVGDTFKCGTEEFYMLGENTNSYYGFAKYNLKIGGTTVINTEDVITYTGFTSDEATNKQDASCAGRPASLTDRPSVRACVTPFGDDSAYEGSLAETYSNRYMEILRSERYPVEMSRPISRVEVRRRCGVADNATGNCNTTYPWMYSTTYWTNTATTDEKVWRVDRARYISADDANKNGIYGIRPVVRILKEYFE